MGFHQQAFPFVALAGPAEADHDRGQGACLMRTPGALRVACREEDQVAELDAAQAVRLVVCIRSRPVPVVEQPAHVHLWIGSVTTRSSGWFAAARSRFVLPAERSGETECVR
jgi:hypothetical protein